MSYEEQLFLLTRVEISLIEINCILSEWRHAIDFLDIEIRFLSDRLDMSHAQ